jgi:telomerase Cajal body protein 1
MNDNRDLTTGVDTVATSACNLVAQSVDINGEGNFLQGCSFSPDGLCILTCTVADAKLRLYNTIITPFCSENDQKSDAEIEDNTNNEIKRDIKTLVQPWTTILSSNGGDSVRSYSWYPLMKSSDPGTCCFLAASR